MFKYVYLPLSVYIHATNAQYPQRPEAGIRSPGTGVTSSREPPSVGDGNLTQVLKNSRYSCPLSRLSNLRSSIVFNWS